MTTWNEQTEQNTPYAGSMEPAGFFVELEESLGVILLESGGKLLSEGAWPVGEEQPPGWNTQNEKSSGWNEQSEQTTTWS